MSTIIPPALVRKLNEDPDFDFESFQRIHHAGDRVTSIRLNPDKPLPPDADMALLDRVPWCRTGFYLPERPVFTLDPFLHGGCYYVQEASSMFLAHVLEDLQLDREPLLALDLCAAPGGKSTLLNAHLHKDSLLVANEPIKSRVAILNDNMMRWGHPKTVVTHNDSAAFSRLPGYFDLLLVDAPCSGSGMMRKDAHALDHWSEAAVKLCKERQQRILSNSLASLKAGGTLIYSTCSYSREENEEIADWLIEHFGLEAVRIGIEPEWGIVETRSPLHGAPGYRFYPHQVRGEGFFLAVFKKKLPQDTFDRKKVKTEKNHLDPKYLSPWLESPQEYYNFLVGGELHVFPERYKKELATLKKVLYLKGAGITVGKIDRDRLIPHHALAMSRIRKDHFPRLELDRPHALNYLRKLPLSPALNPSHRSGWVLVTHESIPLGWAKTMPGRINNYYPTAWRIAHL